MAVNNERIGMIFFGLGRIGAYHCKNLIANTRTKLRWIVEEDVTRAEQFLQDLNISDVRVVKGSDSGIALADKDVKAVMICTPTTTHEKFVLECLGARKAVFCEKPIATSIEGIVNCYKRADNLGLPLHCSFNRRFDPAHSRVVEKAKNGSLGKIRLISTSSGDFNLIVTPEFSRQSNGIFHDMGTHDVDMIIQITGELPTKIYADGHAFAPGIANEGDADSVSITMKFPSGTLGLMRLDRTCPIGYFQQLEVIGNKAIMISDNPRMTGIQVYDVEGVKHDRCPDNYQERYSESYKRSLDHFIDVVQGKAEIKVKMDDCVLAYKLVEACHLSYKTNEVVNFQN